ncbi:MULTISPECIES: PhzF family phenazine biosynthesis protein [Gordonia]|uniref:PhzF family phenazine biosynthesis protein n=1 Tax=Gordonia amicalis TaxID=89053 RepID=A0AAE4R6K1_9ACTN|nr:MULTISPECIES: PhzF family phenazine biosynthesis protein [Gordonia]ATD70068.1 phenazine biosynthesis protein PhzF [Gordonia sp. 1D]MCZ4578953.1 PhzF family phenazine biosynthesis protein [Gordonia amicalis]MDJ0454960.1 PhzF family phenazine biosynthesis protein [Gordonia amicalis]MDV6309502.1 PhzF family phenazine biosynthesis protein [Gordonia amicalis]MDV6311801.1 PhzF family phenazine biosynthesis protein [Gordonia amicalis]
MTRRFAQVDVFSSTGTEGNPVAVVVDGGGPGAPIAEDRMAAFARWTNLSETTFVLPPTDPAADYKLRIFTPDGELPFAGHPTLGSAHAWLTSGGRPKGEDVVQECGVGLVRIRRSGPRLSFAAPPLRRSGPVDPGVVEEVIAALGVDRDEVRAAEWVDNGPEWMVIQVGSGERVLEVRPDIPALGDHKVGLLGLYGSGDVFAEVRAFVPGIGVPEDPVTGSLNAGIASWLRATGQAPESYVAAQGAAIGRAGRVHIHDDGDDIWVGGDTATVIEGTVAL